MPSNSSSELKVSEDISIVQECNSKRGYNGLVTGPLQALQMSSWGARIQVSTNGGSLSLQKITGLIFFYLTISPCYPRLHLIAVPA